MKKFLAIALAILMIVSVLPLSVMASEFDTSVSSDYYKVISENKYNLAPGATETELIVNNATGDDRKIVHYFEVDTKNENIEVIPGYYGIDKLDPNNLPLDGIVDKKEFWKAEQLTKTVAYYEGMGYNVIGAMNTALAYDSDAPYGYMVWNGVVLGSPEVHAGADTYLAIDAEGNCELRTMETPLNGTEVTAISANFGWLVKDGKLVKTSVERTSSDASRSMIGIKADGTLIFCQVDGRNAPISTGLSNYEMGEMMLSLGCVNAVNCDGGGSSTFVSKREGETKNTMRSIPSDGSERATINSAIIVSKAKATGEFDHAVLDTEYDYYAPTTSATMLVKGVDSSGAPAEIPAEGISWALSDDSFGTVVNGVFTSNGTKGDVTVKMLYNGKNVGEKVIHVVDPDNFAFALDGMVLPYGKQINIELNCTYGLDDSKVFVEGAYSLELSNANAAILNGNVFTATTDESILDVKVIATYTPDPTVKKELLIEFGKGSEILYDFEDNDVSKFLGIGQTVEWSKKTGNTVPAFSDDNFSSDVNSTTFLSTRENGGQVKNGNSALGLTLDYTDGDFGDWSYNMMFYVDKPMVLRDVANGMKATTFGMWIYIPEGAAGLAMQLQGYNNSNHKSRKNIDLMLDTLNGKKNLNSCTEADIPESRWVYATADLKSLSYFATFDPYANNVGREPSFIRYYTQTLDTPSKFTFYFDDFTLDYSPAVEDRVLPTIKDVSYTTKDESVALNDYATINGNTIAFSATVADNIKLDNTTAKVYVDGIAIENVSVSGKYLVSEATTLASGNHTVKFEIKDSLGNTAAVSRTFKVAGDVFVTLSGHNDSGNMPESDSIYYIDINVADLANINKLTTQLKLQSANTWEPQGMVIANGFKASYSVNRFDNVLTLDIERSEDTLAVSENVTLVSIPIRVWKWDAINSVTGEPIHPENHFSTTLCPIVTIECEVIKGVVEFTNNESLVSFSGNAISVDTMINDDINPWHYHDAELVALPDVAATCTTNGYSGRTYCEGCASVIDWGTIIEATGHNYEVVDGNVVCGNCGDTQSTTGLVELDGNTYYFINGVAATGWQMIGTDWYYFDPATTVGVDGDVKIGGVTFNFINGKLTSGVWIKTVYGNRYYYGPGYYSNRLGIWANIDGYDYFFDNNGYCLRGGWQLVLENQVNQNWYYFDENGICHDKNIKPADGFYFDRNGYAYSKDGKALLGTQLIDGKYYYFDEIFGYAQTGEHVGRLYGADYTAYTGILEKNNILYYYLDGITGPCGLIEYEGSYYYSYWGGIIKYGKYYVSKSYCDLPAGEYTFGEDGKAINGVYNSRLYVNGKYASEGLYFIDGFYYLAGVGGTLKNNGTYYASKTYCDLPIGEYIFGEDGKMLDGVQSINGELYLYQNGKTVTYGLYEINGEYYYAYWGGLIKTGKQYVSVTYCDLPAGEYMFGEDGKMLNGVQAINGELYLYQNGKTATYGLYEINGEYYYSYWGGLIKTGKQYVGTTYCDLPAGEYMFGEDGKMLDGVQSINGELYLYQNGKTATYGLYEINGGYYYSYWGGLIKTGKQYVGTTYCDLPAGEYMFGKDGKMLDGAQNINGELYLYQNGKTATYGLYEINGEYYYSYWGGLIKTGKQYVGTTYCDLSAGEYMFGADGKMLNGFVTKADGIYYYENGNTPAPKMIFVDGFYYYVSWGGKLLTNGTHYIPADGIYNEIPVMGTFNEFGQLIK